MGQNEAVQEKNLWYELHGEEEPYLVYDLEKKDFYGVSRQTGTRYNPRWEVGFARAIREDMPKEKNGFVKKFDRLGWDRDSVILIPLTAGFAKGLGHDHTAYPVYTRNFKGEGYVPPKSRSMFSRDPFLMCSSSEGFYTITDGEIRKLRDPFDITGAAGFTLYDLERCGYEEFLPENRPEGLLYVPLTDGNVRKMGRIAENGDGWQNLGNILMTKEEILERERKEARRKAEEEQKRQHRLEERRKQPCQYRVPEPELHYSARTSDNLYDDEMVAYEDPWQYEDRMERKYGKHWQSHCHY